MNRLEWVVAGAVLLAGVVAVAEQRDPEERATIRAERKAKRDDPDAKAARRAKQMERRAAMIESQPPMKVRVVGGSLGGTPAGASCPSAAPCLLEDTADEGKVIVVTAIWSAVAINCDGVRAAAPPNQQVASPYWQCKTLSIEGPGAGWLGFETQR